ncbi:MAG: right-handed parallel beta-helix repeat-containing protein [Chloroflexi bacterium]|nr:right-handed parallel beta-helix repeat-containing protein [Chloroflexota bacterium]
MKLLKVVSTLLSVLFAVALSLTIASAANEHHKPVVHPLLGIEPVHTYVVTTTNDRPDNNNPGNGTFRWAILQANSSAGFDRIIFDIPGSGVQTIKAKDDLPEIKDNAGVWIDGKAGDDRIEIDGAQTSNHHGLAVESNNNVIQGLVINNVPDGGTAIGLWQSSNNLIIGNYLGTNPGGTVSRSTHSGIWIGPGSNNNIVGGTNGVTPGSACTGDCNLLSGNRSHGIVIDHASNNKVIGNFIGLNASGTAALQNGDDGVLLGNAVGNTVGGATPAERNVISGNRTINVEIGDTGSKRNLIQGNYIGTNSAGNAAIGGPAAGIVVDNKATDNTLDSNVISGNGGTGILVFLGATRTLIQYNIIGYTADGNGSLRNNGNGVILNASNNQFLSNKLGNHPNDGIRVKAGTGNTIRMNSIHNNGKLGINIAVDGFTPNDPGDADNGPNTLQNFPVVTQAGTNNGTLTIKGNLNSRPNARFALDFYQNPACDNTYFRNVGEGKTYVGSLDVTTNGSGNVSFSTSFGNAPTTGIISATATDAAGNTSEFSTCAAIVGIEPAPTPPQLLSPDNGGIVAQNPPLLDWNPSANAVRYTVMVRQDGTKGVKVHANKNVLTDQYTPPSPFATGHTYYWRVSACNASKVCAKSAWFSFTIQ